MSDIEPGFYRVLFDDLWKVGEYLGDSKWLLPGEQGTFPTDTFGLVASKVDLPKPPDPFRQDFEAWAVEFGWHDTHRPLDGDYAESIMEWMWRAYRAGRSGH